MMNDYKLIMLKYDLQIMHNALDDYLLILIKRASSLIQSEGIVLKEDDPLDDGLICMYAAYLFRLRANSDIEMPKYLRYALNNRTIGRDET